MVFHKLLRVPFGSKGAGGALLGGAKGLARLLDEPIVQGAITQAIPEIAPIYDGVKKSGLLEKAKE